MQSNLYGPPRFLIDADYERIGAHLIEPFNLEQVQPASYDVTLGSKFLVPGRVGRKLDLRKDDPKDYLLELEVELGEHYVLSAGTCVLVATAEKVTCPADMLCSVDGKSTLGRLFMSVHATAGYVDPGFQGRVTLEITNHGPWDIVLYPGMRIAQLRFTLLGSEVKRPYGSPELGSHYQNSEGVRPASVTRGQDAQGDQDTHR